MLVNIENLHPEARGLKLHRHTKKDVLVSCELVMFRAGYSAVLTTLRRAAISGVVKVEPFDEPNDYFADVYTSEDYWEQVVLLDHNSYRILKTRWTPTMLERNP